MARLTAAFLGLLLLVVGLGAAGPAPAIAGQVSCGVVQQQDDAGSGQDAGDLVALSLPLAEEGDFTGLVGALHVGGLDREDWYTVDVPDGERTVMATLTSNYEGNGAGASYLALEAWEDGATAPTYTGSPNAEGDLVLAFTSTEAATWYLRVALTTPTALPACAEVVGATDLVTLYGLYYGCDPHCAPVLSA